ncbi:hypothetical protein D3C80_1461510 [compost metagenome]
MVTLKIVPKEIQVIQMELPPLLINGKVCPVTGNNSTATPILIKAWNTIGNPNPTTSNFPNNVFALCDAIKNLIKSMMYKNMITKAPINPFSSTIIA